MPTSKGRHQRPVGLLQPLKILQWKWEHVTMDFVVGFPRSIRNNDAIWVIVDRQTKSVHFLPMSNGVTMERLVEMYMEETVCLHGVPVSIVSDRDPRFTFIFWSTYQEVMGTELSLSTAFHPRTDRQSERTIQTLEDMLKTCALDFSNSWDRLVKLMKFLYNNCYHSDISMAPFEALYG